MVKALRPQDEEKVATETNNVTFTEFLTYLLSDGNTMIRDLEASRKSLLSVRF